MKKMTSKEVRKLLSEVSYSRPALDAGGYSLFSLQELTQLINAALAAHRNTGSKPSAWMTPCDWEPDPVVTTNEAVAASWRTDKRQVTPLYE